MDYFSKNKILDPGRARGHIQKALDFEQKVAKKHTCEIEVVNINLAFTASWY